MSRKDATFAQLVTYICRDHAADQRFALTHNILAQDQAGITNELEHNGRLLKTRKNGVVLYHEVISITRGRSLSEDAQKQALRKIALDYVKQRAPKCLAYGMLHADHKDHLHYHLVISANEHGQSKRHSLTKAQFRCIQIGLEQRVLTQQPLLEQTDLVQMLERQGFAVQANADEVVHCLDVVLFEGLPGRAQDVSLLSRQAPPFG